MSAGDRERGPCDLLVGGSGDELPEGLDARLSDQRRQVRSGVAFAGGVLSDLR